MVNQEIESHIIYVFFSHFFSILSKTDPFLPRFLYTHPHVKLDLRLQLPPLASLIIHKEILGKMSEVKI